MDDIEAAFQDAWERSKTLPPAATHIQLKLYGLGKQARDGDVTGDRPGMLDIKGRAKYDAWASRRGMAREDAMVEYVQLVEELGG